MLDNKLLKQASRDILLNTYQEICANERMSSNPKEAIVYDNVKKFERRFSKGYNRMGEVIFFPVNQSYEKFYVPVNLYCAADNRERLSTRRRGTNNKVELKNIKDRGNLQRPTLSVYVNGRKVPDEEVFLTVYNGTTELYFESWHLDQDNNTVLITKDAFGGLEDYKYVSTLTHVDENNSVDISAFGDKCVSVYAGGYFISESRYDRIDGKIIFKNRVFDDYQIEVRTNGKYSCHKEVISQTGLINTLEIKHDIPISKYLLEVYVEGLRVSYDKIKELSPKYFEVSIDKESLGLEEEDAVEITYNIHFVDREIYKTLDYNDPYNKALQFFNSKRVEEILYQKYSDDSVAPYLKRKRLDEKYIPQYLPELDPRFLEKDYYEELKEWMKEYMRINPHYLKLFLENFAYDSTSFEYCYADKYPYIRTNTSKELSSEHAYEFKQRMVVYEFKCHTQNFIELVYVKEKLLQSDDYIIERRRGTNYYFVYIKESLIGDNFDVKIDLEISDRLGYTYDIRDLKQNRNEYYFDADRLGYNEDELYFTYSTLDNSTFLPLDKSKLSISFGQTKDLNGGIFNYIRVILLDRVEGMNRIAIHNPYHIRKMEVSKSDLIDDVLIPLVPFNDETKLSYGVPFIDRQENIDVYYNGKLLFEGEEYGLQVPDSTNKADYPYIILKFIPEKDKKVIVVTKEQRTPIVRELETLSSSYGLVYMGDFKLPFSMKYLDVYLNGRKVREDEVEIYALNLFRLKGVKSKKNLYIKSRLNIKDEEIQDLIDACKIVIENGITDSFEKFIAGWFKGKTADDIIEDINKSEGGNEKVEDILDGEIPDTEPPTVDLDYDLGLNELAKALLSGIICKRLDANKPNEKLMEQDFWKYLSDPEIRLNANKFCILVDGTIDTNINYLTRQEIGEIFASEIENGSVVYDEESGYIKFEEDPISDFIYIENEIVLDANELCDDVIVFDPNTETNN